MLDNVFTFETNSSLKKILYVFRNCKLFKAIFFKQQEASFLFFLTASNENTSLSKEKANLTPDCID